jgi:hypothetical protein
MIYFVSYITPVFGILLRDTGMVVCTDTANTSLARLVFSVTLRGPAVHVALPILIIIINHLTFAEALQGGKTWTCNVYSCNLKHYI